MGQLIDAAVQEPCTNAASVEGVEPPDDSELKELQQWEEEQDRIREGMLAARRQATTQEEAIKEDRSALPDHELEAYMNKLFCIADSNDDGVLDPAEFRKLMGMSILAFTDEVIRTVFETIDTNCDGVVQYDEFMAGIMDGLKMANAATGAPLENQDPVSVVVEPIQVRDVSNDQQAAEQPSAATCRSPSWAVASPVYASHSSPAAGHPARVSPSHSLGGLQAQAVASKFHSPTRNAKFQCLP